MGEYEYTNDYEREHTQKYEGIYTPEEIELNKKLYEECQKESINFHTVEELLKKGADPLGPTSGHGWGLLEHIYGELVGPDGYFNDQHLPHLPKITEIFLRYGMDVSSPRIPYDNDNSLHPLFCFLENEYGIKSLQLLLDAGLDAESASWFWSTAIYDQFDVCNDDPNDVEWYDRFVWMMKMVMLVASYDHILKVDEGLQKIVGYTYNTYDIHKFRNWDDYRYVFDTSRCERHPQLYQSVVKIFEIKTDREVWRIGFGLKEGEF